MGHELTTLSFGSLVLIAYWTVPVSELVTDMENRGYHYGDEA